MFNLIITIIAIALVVVLTATSIYYGGSAFSNGSADALAATFVNQAQQVQAANTLFTAQTGGNASTVGQLVTDNFLSSNPTSPSGASWAFETVGADTYAVTGSVIGASNGAGTITEEVCVRINDNGSNLVHCGEGATATLAIAGGAAALVALDAVTVYTKM
jgi:hypothetical protein